MALLSVVVHKQFFAPAENLIHQNQEKDQFLIMTFMILLMMKILQKKETEQPCCLDRPFKLCVFHIKTEDKWLKKVAKPVKITSFTSNTITH